MSEAHTAKRRFRPAGQFGLRALLVGVLVVALLVAWMSDRNRLNRQVQLAGARVETFSDARQFLSRIGGMVQVVTFDDVDTSQRDPARFAADRYASAGIVIQGTQGQYAGRSFSFPTHFTPASPPNMYAPGPPVATGAAARGGHKTVVTFRADGQPAVVTGFGCVFIDADYPSMGPCRLAAFGPDGRLLGEVRGFRGVNGSRLFRGLMAVDRDGSPIAAISRVEIVNGNTWPEDDGGEGVTLDDFTFSPPAPR